MTNYQTYQKKTIGLGCSTFGGSRSKKVALHALDFSFDHGINYLDVARSYGYGQAEAIVGEFIQDKRDKVLLTSKFGISPPRPFPFMQEVKDLVRYAKEKAPGISQKIIQCYSAIFVKRPIITPKMAVKMLEKSLSELRTDYLDTYLIHDCPYHDAAKEDVCAALDKAVDKGMILQWGATCENEKELPMFMSAGSPFDLLQFKYDPHNPYIGQPMPRAASKVLFSVMTQCAGCPEPGPDFFHQLPIHDVAPGLVRNLREAWLYIAFQELDAGVVLCSMTHIKHIKRNLAIADGPALPPGDLRKMKRMVMSGKVRSGEWVRGL